MTVYVDDMQAKYRGMTMCHILADTDAELRQMADKIGVNQKWHQGDHFDICQAKRALAVSHGAQQITQRQAVLIRRKYRHGNPNPASI